LTALELRKWHRDGWGEWLMPTDQRVPAMVALLAIARHERGLGVSDYVATLLDLARRTAARQATIGSDRLASVTTELADALEKAVCERDAVAAWAADRLTRFNPAMDPWQPAEVLAIATAQLGTREG
jgi:hypothetical protein